MRSKEKIWRVKVCREQRTTAPEREEGRRVGEKSHGRRERWHVVLGGGVGKTQMTSAVLPKSLSWVLSAWESSVRSIEWHRVFQIEAKLTHRSFCQYNSS